MVDFSRRGWGPAFLRSVLDDLPARHNLITEHVWNGPYVWLAGRRRADQRRSMMSAAQQQLLVVGTICEDLSRRSGPDGFDWDGIRRTPPDGLYQLLLWDSARQELRITGGVLGARPLYCWGQDGSWVISTTLRAFRHLPTGRPTLDRRGVAETLTLSHPLQDRTVLEGVTHVPASRALRLTERGLTHESRRDAWSSPPSRTSWTLEESADALEEALDRAVVAWAGPDARINIALTGGMDSRLLLPFASRRVRQLEASTFGELDSHEVAIARKLCRLTNTPHRTCELPTDASMSGEDLAGFAVETEWLGDSAGPFYWRRWLPFLEERAAPMLSGYLGDVLGGHRLLSWGVPRGKLCVSAEAARDDVALHPTLQCQAFAPFARGQLRDDFSGGLGARLAEVYSRLPGVQTYERLIALDLSERQRRYVGWFPHVCERSVRSIHPFLFSAVSRHLRADALSQPF